MISVRSSGDTSILLNKGIIFIGSYEDAQDLNFLKKRNVVGIVNCAAELPAYYNTALHYLKVNLYDVPHQDILGSLEKVYGFIEQNLKKGNILVHCAMGKSRSVAIVIGYLMLKFPSLSYDYLLKYIKSRRSVANPNEGFKRQLLTLETS